MKQVEKTRDAFVKAYKQMTDSRGLGGDKWHCRSLRGVHKRVEKARTDAAWAQAEVEDITNPREKLQAAEQEYQQAYDEAVGRVEAAVAGIDTIQSGLKKPWHAYADLPEPRPGRYKTHPAADKCAARHASIMRELSTLDYKREAVGKRKSIVDNYDSLMAAAQSALVQAEALYQAEMRLQDREMEALAQKLLAAVLKKGDALSPEVGAVLQGDLPPIEKAKAVVLLLPESLGIIDAVEPVGEGNALEVKWSVRPGERFLRLDVECLAAIAQLPQGGGVTFYPSGEGDRKDMISLPSESIQAILKKLAGRNLSVCISDEEGLMFLWEGVADGYSGHLRIPWGASSAAAWDNRHLARNREYPQAFLCVPPLAGWFIPLPEPVQESAEAPDVVALGDECGEDSPIEVLVAEQMTLAY